MISNLSICQMILHLNTCQMILNLSMSDDIGQLTAIRFTDELTDDPFAYIYNTSQ